MNASPAILEEKALAEQRRERIRAWLRERRILRVEDICRLSGASPATVRRDLDELASRHAIRRVHGGAVSAESAFDEPMFDDKAGREAAAKRALAAAALATIQSGETIFLDGGSTTLELARLLRDREELTVVTNSLRAAVELSGHGPRLIMAGGELRRRSQTLVGTLTRLILNELRIQKAFMGTIGVTPEQGMTTTDPDEAYTKQLVMERAEEVILLADSSKIGITSFARAGGLPRVHHLITDRRAPKPFLQTARKLGLRVTVVNP